jgi:hypothetical protein
MEWYGTRSVLLISEKQSAGIHGDTTWKGHIHKVSVPSCTGTTLVFVNEMHAFIRP